VKATSGLRGVLAAMLLCNRVDVYGFGKSAALGNGHYYSDPAAGVMAENPGHNYTLENFLIRSLATEVRGLRRGKQGAKKAVAAATLHVSSNGSSGSGDKKMFSNFEKEESRSGSSSSSGVSFSGRRNESSEADSSSETDDATSNDSATEANGMDTAAAKAKMKRRRRKKKQKKDLARSGDLVHAIGPLNCTSFKVLAAAHRCGTLSINLLHASDDVDLEGASLQSNAAKNRSEKWYSTCENKIINSIFYFFCLLRMEQKAEKEVARLARSRGSRKAEAKNCYEVVTRQGSIWYFICGAEK
jgi:hypothetical protein